MSLLNSLNLYLFHQQIIKESLVAFISRHVYAEQEENVLTAEGIVEVLLVGKPLHRLLSPLARAVTFFFHLLLY